jgi:hypothetical protein
MLAFLHVNLPLFLSSPIRPFTINKLFPLQKSKSFLLYEVTSMNLNITEASSSVDKLKINSLLDNLCNILLNSAKSTFE